MTPLLATGGRILIAGLGDAALNAAMKNATFGSSPYDTSMNQAMNAASFELGRRKKKDGLVAGIPRVGRGFMGTLGRAALDTAMFTGMGLAMNAMMSGSQQPQPEPQYMPPQFMPQQYPIGWGG